VTCDPNNASRFNGLPKQWEEWLLDNGITREELIAHPKEAFTAAAYFRSERVPKPMPSRRELEATVRETLNILNANPKDIYICDNKIGTGSTGFVYNVTHRKSLKSYALKLVSPKNKK